MSETTTAPAPTEEAKPVPAPGSQVPAAETPAPSPEEPPIFEESDPPERRYYETLLYALGALRQAVEEVEAAEDPGHSDLPGRRGAEQALRIGRPAAHHQHADRDSDEGGERARIGEPIQLLNLPQKRRARIQCVDREDNRRIARQ